MPNMSYCRFENTCRDLQDCQRYIDKERKTGIILNLTRCKPHGIVVMKGVNK